MKFVLYFWALGFCLFTNASELPSNLSFVPSTTPLSKREALYNEIPKHIQSLIQSAPMLFETLKEKKQLDPYGNIIGPNCHTFALAWNLSDIQNDRLHEFDASITANKKQAIDTEKEIKNSGKLNHVSLSYVNNHFQVLAQTESLNWRELSHQRILQEIKTLSKNARQGDMLQVISAESGRDEQLDAFDHIHFFEFTKDKPLHSMIFINNNWLFEKRNYFDDQFQIHALDTELAAAILNYKPSNTVVGSRDRYTLYQLKLRILRPHNR